MNNRCRDILRMMLTTILATVLLSACSLIDDELGEKKTTDYKLDYELRLVTNMTTEIKTQLSTQLEVGLAHALRQHLSGIFTDYAHDVDLSFYDTVGDSLRLQHDQHIMDANQQSYTLYLPMRQYMHLAVANVVNNAVVGLEGGDRCHQSRLNTVAGSSPETVVGSSPADTINSHTTGLFTARQPMKVLEGVNQTFNVHLYMANCAAALVIDPRGHDISSIQVYTTGFASRFNICDSSYVFAPHDPIVRTQLVTSADDNRVCYCSVNLPSREPIYNKGTRSIIETEDFLGEPGNEDLWSFIAIITKKDGTKVRTDLTLKEPLRAGQLKILTGWVSDDSSVKTEDQTVSVSVSLNWNPGGNYEPEL